MAQYLINDTTLTALGDKVREKTGETSQLSLDNVINTEVDKIFNAGKKSEYDAFWDHYQLASNGVSQVTTTDFMFAGQSWSDAIFKPKYSMENITSASNMFFSSYITDLSAILERQGVVFDFSKAKNFSYMFYNSKITKIPEINATGQTLAAAFNYMFQGAKSLHTIEKLVLKDDGSQMFFANTFNNCTNLENITIEGTIGQNGFNVQWSTNLTHDSLMSIINALQDKTGDTSGTVWTVTLGADNIVKLTDEEQQIARDKGWVIE